MQAFFISFSNLINEAFGFIKSLFENFFSLLRTLKDALTFVTQSISLLPDIFKIPMMAIIGVMFIKFLLSLGKQ